MLPHGPFREVAVAGLDRIDDSAVRFQNRCGLARTRQVERPQACQMPTPSMDVLMQVLLVDAGEQSLVERLI